MRRELTYLRRSRDEKEMAAEERRVRVHAQQPKSTSAPNPSPKNTLKKYKSMLISLEVI